MTPPCSTYTLQHPDPAAVWRLQAVQMLTCAALLSYTLGPPEQASDLPWTVHRSLLSGTVFRALGPAVRRQMSRRWQRCWRTGAALVALGCFPVSMSQQVIRDMERCKRCSWHSWSVSSGVELQHDLLFSWGCVAVSAAEPAVWRGAADWWLGQRGPCPVS